MKYSECSYQIQKEGQLIGMPSVFFNLSGNKEITREEITSTIDEYGCRHLVITGVEPFLRRDDLETLCFMMSHYHKTIETKGSIFYEVPANLFSLSPILGNSTSHKQVQTEVIDQFIDYCNFSAGRRDYQIKFKIDDGSELEEIQDLLSDLEHVNPSNIFLLAGGKTLWEIEEKQIWLTDLCMAHGFRYGAGFRSIPADSN